ncbi:MAG: ABC transporter permease [Nanoarchaeota archaeon]|nr:ABC transporter permease [Nanoarchaeota archaeon]
MKHELLKYAVFNILHRKMRSLLTVISIMIGIMAVFALVSFGLGIQRYVNEVANESGADKLFLQGKGNGAMGDTFYISRDTLEVVKKVKGVELAVGQYIKFAKLKYKDQVKYHYIMGSDPKENDFVQESFGIDIVKGRALKSGELGKVVVGYNYLSADKVFKRPLYVGEKIYINDAPFEIVGFVSEIGNPDDDANIYLTDSGMELLYPEVKDKFSFVMAKAEDGVDPTILADYVNEKVRKHLGEEEGKETFEVQSFSDAIKTFTTIIDIINVVLVLIALVSVIVASVNIMNTMYTAVLERTKEIGVMKSIGARNSDIRDIFLIESGIIGLTGGIIGIILGYVVASTGGSIAAAAGFSSLQPIFPFSLILGCALFSLMIGMVSGIFPAIQASRQRPVEALRYE